MLAFRRSGGTDSATGPGVLRDALTLLAAVWSVLAVAPLLCGGLGRDAALLIAFGAATALTLAASGRVLDRARNPWRLGRALIVGVAVGWIVHPSLCGWIGVLGEAIGLEPMAVWRATDPDGNASVRVGEGVAVLLLAPVFEEILYRARLLPALSRWVGSLPALLASSALFALPHLEPWPMLGTFVAGGLLGAAWLVFEDVFLCIGLHAGMNLSALMWARGGGA